MVKNILLKLVCVAIVTNTFITIVQEFMKTVRMLLL